MEPRYPLCRPAAAVLFAVVIAAAPRAQAQVPSPTGDAGMNAPPPANAVTYDVDVESTTISPNNIVHTRVEGQLVAAPQAASGLLRATITTDDRTGRHVRRVDGPVMLDADGSIRAESGVEPLAQHALLPIPRCFGGRPLRVGDECTQTSTAGRVTLVVHHRIESVGAADGRAVFELVTGAESDVTQPADGYVPEIRMHVTLEARSAIDAADPRVGSGWFLVTTRETASADDPMVAQVLIVSNVHRAGGAALAPPRLDIVAPRIACARSVLELSGPSAVTLALPRVEGLPVASTAQPIDDRGYYLVVSDEHVVRMGVMGDLGDERVLGRVDDVAVAEGLGTGLLQGAAWPIYVFAPSATRLGALRCLLRHVPTRNEIRIVVRWNEYDDVARSRLPADVGTAMDAVHEQLPDGSLTSMEYGTALAADSHRQTRQLRRIAFDVSFDALAFSRSQLGLELGQRECTGVDVPLFVHLGTATSDPALWPYRFVPMPHGSDRATLGSRTP